MAHWSCCRCFTELPRAAAAAAAAAGGRGAVTFELVVRWGVRCTLLEPRPAKLSREQHRQLREAGRPADFQMPQVCKVLGLGAAGAGV